MATIELEPTTTTRASLIAAAGDPATLKAHVGFNRASHILTNMAQGQPQDVRNAAFDLLRQASKNGLCSQSKSVKLVQAQIERCADALLERAKIETAKREAVEAVTLYDAGAWLADGSLVPLSAEEVADIAQAFRVLPGEEGALSAGEAALLSALDTLGVQGLLESDTQAWVRSLSPVGLPLALFPDAPSALELTAQRARRDYPSRQQLHDEEPEPPTPSSPAAAPVPQQYGSEADFEQFCLVGDFFRQYHQALPHILNAWYALTDNWLDEVGMVSDDVVGWLEEESAEWEGSFAA